MQTNKELREEMQIESEENRTVGDIIRNSRIDMGISQRELAKRLNISKSYMNNLENDKVKKPGYMILFAISRELNLKSYKEYWLFLFAGYTSKEMVKLGVLNSNEGIEVLGYDYLDEDDRYRVNLRKALKDYRNKKLTENEMLAIIYSYIDFEENPNYSDL